MDLVAEMSVYNPFDFFLEPSAQHFPFSYEPDVLVELAPYLQQEPLTPLLKELLASIDRKERGTVDFLVDLNMKLHQRVRVPDPHGARRADARRDPAKGLGLLPRQRPWLMVQVLRHLGLAALCLGLSDPAHARPKALDGPSGTEVDFTDLHAWCEVFLPGAGWIGLDPTSGLLCRRRPFPLACTPQPSSAAPISGAVDECEVEFGHEMVVTRVWEARASPSLTPSPSGSRCCNSVSRSTPSCKPATCA